MNNYNTIIKGQLLLEKHQHFFIFDEDKLEVPVSVSPKFYNWIVTNNIDISYPRIYQGQLKTDRMPYLKIDQLRNMSLDDNIAVPETFELDATVFKVFNNCVSKYDADYNFLLAIVGQEPYRFPIKICYSQLDNHNLIKRRIKFQLKRVGYALVLQSYLPLDVDEPTKFGVISHD